MKCGFPHWARAIGLISELWHDRYRPQRIASHHFPTGPAPSPQDPLLLHLSKVWEIVKKDEFWEVLKATEPTWVTGCGRNSSWKGKTERNYVIPAARAEHRRNGLTQKQRKAKEPNIFILGFFLSDFFFFLINTDSGQPKCLWIHIVFS